MHTVSIRTATVSCEQHKNNLGQRVKPAWLQQGKGNMRRRCSRKRKKKQEQNNNIRGVTKFAKRCFLLPSSQPHNTDRRFRVLLSDIAPEKKKKRNKIFD